MERELWATLYALARRLEPREARGIFPASCIVSVFLWAVIHDRPVSWACDARNWPAQPHRRLPSQATMSRRLRSPAVQQLLDKLLAVLLERDSSWVKVVDAKPLPVGGHSKDPDARWGRGVGNFIKGYKFYAIWSRGPLPLAWDVAAASTSEQRMAEVLIPTLSGGGYLLGDKLYDINKLYDAAGRTGHQLVAPRKRPNTGLGHRRHSPYRLHGIDLLQTPFGQALYAQRNQIEQRFAQLTNFAGGLAPLPNWVRRLPRVKQWLKAKLLIHAARIQKLHPTTMQAIA